MTGIQDISLPTPAIILSIGSFAEATAAQVRNIYLRGDPRRKQVTVFLALSGDESGGLKLASLGENDTVLEQAAGEPGPKKRQVAFQHTVKHAEAIRAQINQHIYDIRTHDLLIHAGWEKEYDIPVNVYILADAKEPDAAGAVLPLACLLSDIAHDAHLCKVFALLNTAVFPSAADGPDKDRDVEVYSFLLELNDLLEDQSKYREKLCKALFCDNTDSLQIGVYLFDSNKEGSVHVKDNSQMQVMVGNALLALLEDEIARKLDERHDRFEIAEQHSYFHSIGASTILYDPDTLQKACAARVSREFLESIVLFETADAQMAAGEAQAIQNKLGDLRAWLERCVVEMPPVIGQVRIQSDTNILTLLLTDLMLAEMDFEHFRSLPWSQEARNYLAAFDQEIKPKVLARVIENAQDLEKDLAEILKETITALPVRPDLYPGGIRNAARTLEFLAKHFDHAAEKVKKLQQQLQQDRSKASARLDEVLTEIQAILDRAPGLPWLIRILPKFARVWAAPLYYARRYGRQILKLQELNKETIQQVHALCSISVQSEALSKYAVFIPRLLEQIDAGLSDYQNFENRLDSAKEKLPAGWPDFPLGQTENGWDMVFRLPLVEHCLADWALSKYHPQFEKWIYEFLAEISPVLDWRNITGEAIYNWIIELAKAVYDPLWQITADDIFAAWANNDHGFKSGDPAVTPTIMIGAMRAALPLLKPDFDAAGGSKSSTISSHALLGQPDWKAFKLPAPLTRDDQLEVNYTGDPYAGIFMQVRHYVPLAALVEMTRTGRHKYNAMPPSKKLDYLIVQSEQGGNRQPPDVVDPNNPDIVRKEFHWKFKPKGSKIEFDQSICLEISRSRFEQFRRKPRFNGEWNRYAEEEMPEVRALAMEFQRLHAGQNWSAYNQAFNVLNFVQCCIPYSYDEDTTGFDDWARYPIESLMEETGDCEDVAILCAAVISRLGFQTVLLLYPSHLAFGVAGADNLKGDYVVEPTSGKRFYYGEATAKGRVLGEIPSSYAGKAPEHILPVTILLTEE